MGADERPVLVIGATGHQGGAAARHLLAAGWSVRALVRNGGAPAARALRAAGATLAVGDLDEPATVRAALDGAARVFLALNMMVGPRISAPAVVTERRRGEAVAELAARAGIEHLVYSSISGADFDEHPAPPIETERLRNYHPGLLRLETWLRATHWKP